MNATNCLPAACRGRSPRYRRKRACNVGRSPAKVPRDRRRVQSDLTDLIESDFDVTPGDGLKTLRTLFENNRLRSHFRSNTEAIEQTNQVKPDGRSCGRIVVPDRFRSAQRLARKPRSN